MKANFSLVMEEYNNSTEVVITRLYNPDLPMAFGLIATTLNVLFVTPISYSIIWYERYGSELRRILPNQLVSSIFWNIIFQNVVTVPLEILLTLTGPLNEIFCSVHMVLKYSCIIHIIAMMTFITFIKYISIFVLKNPTNLQNDFWCLVINIATLLFCLLSQSVYFATPGKNPFNFYICTGHYQSRLDHQPTKKNYPFIFVILLSYSLYIFALIKIKFFQKKISPQEPDPTVPIDQETLVNLGTIAIMFASFALAAFSYSSLNNISAKELDSLKYVMLVHFFHHGIGLMYNFVLIVTFFSKSAIMRQTILKDFSSWMKGIYNSITCSI